MEQTQQALQDSIAVDQKAPTWKHSSHRAMDSLDETTNLLIIAFAFFTIQAVRGCPDVPDQRANWSGRQMLQFGLATGMMAFLAFVTVQRGSGRVLGAFVAACVVTVSAISAPGIWEGLSSRRRLDGR